MWLGLYLVVLPPITTYDLVLLFFFISFFMNFSNSEHHIILQISIMPRQGLNDGQIEDMFSDVFRDERYFLGDEIGDINAIEGEEEINQILIELTEHNIDPVNQGNKSLIVVGIVDTGGIDDAEHELDDGQNAVLNNDGLDILENGNRQYHILIRSLQGNWKPGCL